MKFISILLISISMMACQKTGQSENKTDDHSDHMTHKQSETGAKKPKSPRTASMAMIDGNHIHVDYSSPRVRGRQIFGGLVAYGEVWVTGAHKATNISFDKDVNIAGQKIEAGKYGLFTIPNMSSWTVIINRNWDMHLADDYDQSMDIIRLEVPVEEISENQEELLIEVVSKESQSGNISITWADRKISFEIKNNQE